jgi:hypothetical protein
MSCVESAGHLQTGPALQRVQLLVAQLSETMDHIYRHFGANAEIPAKDITCHETINEKSVEIGAFPNTFWLSCSAKR